MIRAIVSMLIFATALAWTTAQAQVWKVRSIAQLQGTQVRLKAKDGAVVEVVQRASVARIADVTDKMAPLYGIPTPELFIEIGSAPNAYVTMHDGRSIMVVNTEMLKLVGNDDDLMAAVVGHELGHLKAEHVTKGQNTQAVVGLIGALLGAAIDINQAKHGRDTQGAGTAIGGLGANLMNAKFSRDQEREADGLGIRTMAQAGYNPAAAADLWRRMERMFGTGSGVWLASHPSNEERLQAMQVAASGLGSTYLASRTPRSLPTVTDPYPVARYFSFEPLTVDDNVSAGLYRSARDAQRAGRIDEAAQLYKEAAALGDERAMTMLGDFADTGRGQPIDSAQARQHYLAAAAKGFAPAIYALGLQSGGGRGTARDPEEAGRLLVIAANRNVPRANAYLALLCLDEKPFGKDPVMARSLAEKAAATDAMGKAVLGMLLRDGLGGPSDPVKSFSLLQQAAATNLPWAMHQLAISYERGAGVPPDKEKAVESYKTAAASGYAPSKRRLEALGLAQ